MYRASFRTPFAPNSMLPASARLTIVVLWLGLIVLFWSQSRFTVLPQPAEVINGLLGLWMTGGLAGELRSSLFLNLRAIAITTVLSLLISYATVLPVFRPLATLVSKGRFLGLSGLALVFTLAFGGGVVLKLTLLVFGMSVFFVTSMVAEIDSIPASQYDYARTLGLNEWQVAWEVVVLGTLDRAFEVLRQNAAIGWMMLTMVEGLVRSEGGVGALMLDQNRHFHMAEVFGIQILILILGLVQDIAIGALKRFLLPYSELTRKKHR